MAPCADERGSGFSLIEMVMTIAITGILVAIAAVFIQKPIQGYFDSTRRAELTDTADTAIKRLTRDLRLALPNSVRLDPTRTYLEFLITSGGGRYRAELDSSGAGDILDFTTADASFAVIGSMPIALASNLVVVYNLGIPGSDAYAATNRATISSVAGNIINLSPSFRFPFESPGKRFQVVQYPVTYQCSPDAANPANGVLQRFWNYAITAAQPTSFATPNTAKIATNVSGCSFTYNASVVAQRAGVVIITLQLTNNRETVSLVTQAHVSNVP